MGMTLIQTITVTSPGIITFSAIPQGYTHLVLVASLRSLTAGPDNISLKFNGDAGANYDQEIDRQAGNANTAPFEFLAAGSILFINAVSNANSPAGEFGAAVGWIPFYTDTTRTKHITIQAGCSVAYTTGNIFVMNMHGGWRSTAAITSIVIQSGQPNLAAGSVVSLYGVS